MSRFGNINTTLGIRLQNRIRKTVAPSAEIKLANGMQIGGQAIVFIMDNDQTNLDTVISVLFPDQGLTRGRHENCMRFKNCRQDRRRVSAWLSSWHDDLTALRRRLDVS